jgi:hypothetical protein
VRWLLASLLGLVGGLAGLLGAIMCVTIVLAPLGVLLLMLSQRLFRMAGDLVIPRKVRHPLEALGGAASDAADDLAGSARKRGKSVRKRGRKATRKARKKVEHAL